MLLVDLSLCYKHIIFFQFVCSQRSRPWKINCDVRRAVSQQAVHCLLFHVGQNNVIFPNFASCQHQAVKRNADAWKESLRYGEPLMDKMAGIRRITLNGNPTLGDRGAGLLADALKDDRWIKGETMLLVPCHDFLFWFDRDFLAHASSSWRLADSFNQ